MKEIKIKPHHLLDIIKLYGAGVEVFQPDTIYKHNFYRVGNLVLKDPSTLVQLALGCDDVCNPCVFNNNGTCRDVVAGTNIMKEDYNRQIDSRLLSFLKFNVGDIMTVQSYCAAVHESFDAIKLREVWSDESDMQFQKRIENLQKGLTKYITRNG